MNEDLYGQLLLQYRPRTIETADEHDAMLTIAETLMERGEAIGPEEERLLALVVMLIEAFESGIEAEDEEDDDDNTAEPPAPHLTLKRLMEKREMEITDVQHIFGNPHLTQQVLEGKKPISRGQAKALGSLFRMPAKLFQA